MKLELCREHTLNAMWNYRLLPKLRIATGSKVILLCHSLLSSQIHIKKSKPMMNER